MTTYYDYYEDDENVVLDESLIDLETLSDDPGQLPEHEWYNSLGFSEAVIQFQTVDFTPDELYYSDGIEEELDAAEVGEIDREMRDTQEEVPYEYQYWLHGENEFPDTPATLPPESGDVDPETGELVP